MFLSIPALYAQDIVAYNKIINQAETSLIRNDFTTSARLYNSAFLLSGDKAFGRDLLNAFHCAMDCRNEKNAELYLKMLLKKGVPRQAFEYLILKWYKTADEKNKIEGWFHKHENDTLKENTIAKTLKIWLDSDQIDRRFANEHSDDAGIQLLMNKQDSARAQKLYSLFVKKGVPDISTVGFLDDNSLSHPLYWILVLHNSQGYDGYGKSHLFDELMYKSVFQWKINASEFFELLNNSDLGLLNPPCEQIGKVNLCYPLTCDILQLGMDPENATYELERFGKETEARINKMRSQFGVETLEETHAKFTYTKTKWRDIYDGKYKLLAYAGNNLLFLDKKAYDKKIQASLAR